MMGYIFGTGLGIDREIDTDIASRLAALEAADPSQQRPKKRRSALERVDFMEWQTWQELGLSPPAGEQRHWARPRQEAVA